MRRFAFLVALAFAIYLPALRGPFFWDDDELVYQNPDVTAPGGILHVWANGAASEYTPVATASYWFEWGLWKRHTLGYHVDNVLLHALAAFLIWLVLEQLKIPGASAAAVLFLAHPLCVESVAWISERRNVLSLVFYLGAVLFYMRFEAAGARRDYAAVLALFTAALLTKATVVILPMALLLLVWWRRGRIGRKDLARVAPLFLLALAGGAVRIWFEMHRATNSGTLADSTLAARAGTAVQAIGFYAAKVVWPVNLCLIYPRLTGAAAIGAAALLVLCRWRGARFAVLYFLLALAPALGLVRMAYQQHADVADHFAYMALIAPVALAGAGAARWGRLGLVLAGVTAAVLMGFTVQRAWYFGHPDELWQLTARQNPAAWTAHEHVAIARYERRDFSGAAGEFQRSLELHPGNYRAWFNLGTSWHLLGRYPEAAAAYAQVLALRPGLAQAVQRLEACRRRLPLAP